MLLKSFCGCPSRRKRIRNEFADQLFHHGHRDRSRGPAGVGTDLPNGSTEKSQPSFPELHWLVLLFIVMLTFPFEIEIGETIISIPDWMKADSDFSCRSWPTSRKSSGELSSLSQPDSGKRRIFASRRQILLRIILPQCFKRMIPLDELVCDSCPWYPCSRSKKSSCRVRQ